MNEAEKETAVGTFVAVTSCDAGTSRAIMEQYKWDLDRSVDAFFDGSWQNALIDAQEAKDLAASGASPPSPPVATVGVGLNLNDPVIDLGDDDADEDPDYAPSPPGFERVVADGGGAARRPLGDIGGGGRDFHYVVDDDDDMEDQMMNSAIAASMDAGVITIDDDGDAAAAAKSPHQMDHRPPPLAFGGRGIGIGIDGMGGAGGAGGDFELPDGIDREEARMIEAAMLGVPYEPPAHRLGVSGGGGGGGGGGDRGLLNAGGVPAPAEVMEARLIQNETDYAYEESLRMDRAKEAAARAKREEEARAERAAAEAAAAAAAAAKAEAEMRDAAVAAASSALPDEPAAGGDGVVDVAIRLPSGGRVRRRFLRTHALSAVFSFLIAEGHLEHGSFKLARQFPRGTFTEDGEGGKTLEELGLTQRQEALYVESTSG